MTIEKRTPTFATFNQDQAGYVEQTTGETSTLEYDPRLNQVRIIFYTAAAATAARQFYEDAALQQYLSTKKRLISRVRSAMREHSPARG